MSPMRRQIRSACCRSSTARAGRDSGPSFAPNPPTPLRQLRQSGRTRGRPLRRSSAAEDDIRYRGWAAGYAHPETSDGVVQQGRMAGSRAGCVAALCAVVLLAPWAEAAGPGGAMQGATRRLSMFGLDDFESLAACQTTSSASLLITGGSAAVGSTATCEAQIEAIDNITSIVRDWLDAEPKEACTKKSISRVAEAIAFATATAYSNATLNGETSYDFEGTACASAESKADAFATAFARAVLKEPVNDKTVKTTSDGLCLSGSMSVVFAEAWARTQLEHCLNGVGNFSVEQEAYAKRVQSAMARVIVELASLRCKDNEEVNGYKNELIATSVTPQNATVLVDTFASELAMASGGTLFPCIDDAGKCCGGRGGSDQCPLEQMDGFIFGSPETTSCCCVDELLAFLDS
eukprot:evm.model.scf_71.11 EVM.evm.TU.scf_71.11   scf_71:155012-159363(+)